MSRGWHWFALVNVLLGSILLYAGNPVGFLSVISGAIILFFEAKP